jgi:aerobic carbon-monoxide dehydrogenase large subunit
VGNDLTLEAGRFVGRSVLRREDPRMLAGRGRYVADVSVPGMLHAAFVRSDVARGTIVRIDASTASRLPGVHAIYTAEDLDPVAGPMWGTLYTPPAAGPPARPLARGDVRFVGDSIAIVIAENRYVAEDAAALVDVEIEPLPAVIDLADAASDRRIVHAELGTNIAASVDTLDERAWSATRAGAAHVVSRTFTQARAANVPMEGRAIVADWDAWTPELRIWSATQNVHEVRACAARLVGIPEHQVRVISDDVGGGFGMKIFVSPDEACVILAARQLGRPVSWIEDRLENLLAAGHARHDEATIEVAFDTDARILAMRIDHLEDVGAFPVGGAGSSTGSIKRLAPGPYRVGSVYYRGRALYTNTCGRVAYRGPWMFETVLRERVLDHAAREMGIDPLELRRRNVIQTSELPHVTATGSRYVNITPAETLDQAAELIGYESFRESQAAARAEGRLVGIGLAMFVEPTGMGAGLLGSDTACIRISPSGTVDVFIGTGSTGNSVETTIPQVVAEHLGCRLADVVFHQGDTASAPWGHGSGGSRAAVVAGGAARETSLVLHERIMKVAAELLEASADDLEMAESVISVRGTPARAVALANVAAFVYAHPEALPSGEQGLEAQVRYRSPDAYTFSNACHACTCEVDAETGEVSLRHYVVSEDCGRLINPMVVEGQIAGGVVQGIGGALHERFLYDDEGTPLTTTFLDYLLPTADGIPRFTFGHVETPSATSGGFKGMGEGGAIAAPAAVANAVADALAAWTTDVVLPLPMGPADVLAVITSVTPRDLGATTP